MRFARTVQLVGEEKMERLQQARVAVCGLGAVGSYAVEALARAGVGYLRLVDHDTVSEVNINRQLFALDSTVGEPKVEVAASRVRDINPACETDLRRTFIDAASMPDILSEEMDVVIDAIDGVSSKVSLLEGAYSRGLYTVSSMGAAARLDVSEIHVTDISESYNCPLARTIRRRLHRKGIAKGIRCVFSPAQAYNKLPPVMTEEKNSARGRERTPLGSISYVTGIFGLKAASEVIRHILEV